MERALSITCHSRELTFRTKFDSMFHSTEFAEIELFVLFSSRMWILVQGLVYYSFYCKKNPIKKQHNKKPPSFIYCARTTENHLLWRGQLLGHRWYLKRFQRVSKSCCGTFQKYMCKSCQSWEIHFSFSSQREGHFFLE